MTGENQRNRRRTALAVAGIAALLTLVLLASAPAVAENNTTNLSDKAPYYANETSDVANESWMQGRENATLDNILAYAGRIDAFIIGSGYETQGNTGYAAPLLVGVLLAGGIIGTGVGTGVGLVGGGVIMVSTVYAFVQVGIAPQWLYALVLFGVGLILSTILKRVYG
ncbi:hypothetical protein [Haloparvum sp. AD34]